MLSEKTFLQHLNTILNQESKVKILLAVSGGSDSMVLLHLFRISNFEFQVAHINYKLRGEESDLDEQLVRIYCEKHQIPLHVYSVKEEEKPENSIQTWARDLRYTYFRNIAKEQHLDFISTAHHLNDTLETFIINLSRGSGIRGLSGIPENDNQIIRPLLGFSKKEILEFAERNEIEFRDDKSNFKDDYLRNQIRNHIVPKLLKTNADFLTNFSKSIQLLKQTKTTTEEYIEKIYNAIFKETSSEIRVLKNEFSSQTSFIQFELFRKFGFESKNEIQKMLTSENGSTFQSPNFDLWVVSDAFIFKDVNKKERKEKKSVTFSHSDTNKTLSLSEFSKLKKPSEGAWLLNADKIHFPLKVRRRESGDAFYPIGMDGRKKISKYCKDEKIPPFDRGKIWILTDAKNQILGIVGFRQDRRFAATLSTEKVFKITF